MSKRQLYVTTRTSTSRQLKIKTIEAVSILKFEAVFLFELISNKISGSVAEVLIHYFQIFKSLKIKI